MWGDSSVVLAASGAPVDFRATQLLGGQRHRPSLQKCWADYAGSGCSCLQFRLAQAPICYAIGQLLPRKWHFVPTEEQTQGDLQHEQQEQSIRTQRGSLDPSTKQPPAFFHEFSDKFSNNENISETFFRLEQLPQTILFQGLILSILYLRPTQMQQICWSHKHKLLLLPPLLLLLLIWF